MTFASVSQFHVYLPWGQCPFSIVSYYCLKCASGSIRFQLGEGPSRGLLRDYERSDGPLFQALFRTWLRALGAG